MLHFGSPQPSRIPRYRSFCCWIPQSALLAAGLYTVLSRWHLSSKTQLLLGTCENIRWSTASRWLIRARGEDASGTPSMEFACLVLKYIALENALSGQGCWCERCGLAGIGLMRTDGIRSHIPGGRLHLQVNVRRGDVSLTLA